MFNFSPFFSQELEDFCFKFAVNHMTAVVQTDAFHNLDEVYLKEFLNKAAQWGAFKYWQEAPPYLPVAPPSQPGEASP